MCVFVGEMAENTLKITKLKSKQENVSQNMAKKKEKLEKVARKMPKKECTHTLTNPQGNE